MRSAAEAVIVVGGCMGAALKVCVCVDADSAAAKPFYEGAGASPFNRFWYRWDDISALHS